MLVTLTPCSFTLCKLIGPLYITWGFRHARTISVSDFFRFFLSGGGFLCLPGACDHSFLPVSEDARRSEMWVRGNANMRYGTRCAQIVIFKENVFSRNFLLIPYRLIFKHKSTTLTWYDNWNNFELNSFFFFLLFFYKAIVCFTTFIGHWEPSLPKMWFKPSTSRASSERTPVYRKSLRCQNCLIRISVNLIRLGTKINSGMC